MGNTYQEAIENSNIVSKTDINGIITFVNDEFCKISGYSRNELVGQNHNIVRHPDALSSNFKTLWDTILSKKPYKSTVKNLSKNGNTVYLNTTITPILDDNGKIKEFIAIRYDVTKEIELQKTLEEKQKILFLQSRMASLGQMLGNIAHQWRQPLTELNLTIFNMKKAHKNNDDEKIDELYKDSKNIILNMSNTIEDFTNFFNPQKEEKLFLLKDAVEEALIILKKVLEKEEIKLNLSIDSHIEVLGVSNELSQVIINLVQNAKDAFIINNLTNRSIEIVLKDEIIENKEYATIYIKDNALGVNKESIDKIFEPYFTTKHKSQGTGLGLFMSKMIIEKSLDGEISHKNIDNGSMFTISIPKSMESK
ncbi:PAS domain-containing sensor histidine kinase [Poseidonibacter ostreae]|jgi:PAS domain S-box-containing protein|uniref:histidine kinase n=1 Tax=Poseidonibacter ostreae TaxID=2654171 RepID=A0A6L4WS25_9BACT|nr:PAS domain-containing sensor histidine kinase [Poseidonibacter ostreae]KAB7887126.1 PAS domain S-box protein [Poseidonibacter ostreae]KAB7888632.1 PAS domain S-box protein [Poseidonibacter ostreae]KAB7892321.1 PAS domain S-box protein [Poseidonibacter ostreae]